MGEIYRDVLRERPYASAYLLRNQSAVAHLAPNTGRSILASRLPARNATGHMRFMERSPSRTSVEEASGLGLKHDHIPGDEAGRLVQASRSRSLVRAACASLIRTTCAGRSHRWSFPRPCAWRSFRLSRQVAAFLTTERDEQTRGGGSRNGQKVCREGIVPAYLKVQT